MIFTKIICSNDCLTHHFRIFSKGLSEYPLLRFWQIKGLAVGLVRRYPMMHQNNPIYDTLRFTGCEHGDDV